MASTRLGKDDDEGQFNLPEDIRQAAKSSAEHILIKPSKLVEMMDEADVALNGDSNDAEHDALFSLREQLSDLFEDPYARV